MYRQILKLKQKCFLLTNMGQKKCIWMQNIYFIVELEGPVVDVDVLKLEVVDEVLQHVRHPDTVPSAPPQPPTTSRIVGLTKS